MQTRCFPRKNLFCTVHKLWGFWLPAQACYGVTGQLQCRENHHFAFQTGYLRYYIRHGFCVGNSLGTVPAQRPLPPEMRQATEAHTPFCDRSAPLKAEVSRYEVAENGVPALAISQLRLHFATLFGRPRYRRGATRLRTGVEAIRKK